MINLNFKSKVSNTKIYKITFTDVRIEKDTPSCLAFNTIITDEVNNTIYHIEGSYHWYIITKKEKQHILDNFNNIIIYLKRWAEENVEKRVYQFHMQRLEESMNNFLSEKIFELEIKGDKIL